MWLFSETGFLSAVQKDSSKPYLAVRARDKKSLADICEKYRLEIIETPMADYPYRVEMPKDQFAEWVVGEIEQINYSNLKNQVALVRDSKFAKLLGSVWSIMLGAEDKEARGKA